MGGFCDKSGNLVIPCQFMVVYETEIRMINTYKGMTNEKIDLL